MAFCSNGLKWKKARWNYNRSWLSQICKVRRAKGGGVIVGSADALDWLGWLKSLSIESRRGERGN
jgi:hypothetical protein